MSRNRPRLDADTLDDVRDQSGLMLRGDAVVVRLVMSPTNELSEMSVNGVCAVAGAPDNRKDPARALILTTANRAERLAAP